MIMDFMKNGEYLVSRNQKLDFPQLLQTGNFLLVKSEISVVWTQLAQGNPTCSTF